MAQYSDEKSALHYQFSCVLDNSPKFFAQVFIWVTSLQALGNIPPRDIYVHVVDGAQNALIPWLHKQGVNVVPIKPFDERNRYLNKLQQLKTFEAAKADYVVLMDCDTALTGPFNPAGQRQAPPVLAKIVDFANPPQDLLADIFRAAGVGEPDWSFPTFEVRQETDWNNCNGGLYVIRADWAQAVGAAWQRWASWGLAHRHLFGKATNHVDQVAFALALRELGLRTSHLELIWNFPLHVSPEQMPDVEPVLVHYHDQLTPHLTVLEKGNPALDRAIRRINQASLAAQAAGHMNQVFWDARYALHPELGSGVASRGEVLNEKRDLLQRLLASPQDIASVLDIGCGDLEAVRHFPFPRYTGVDISKEALGIGRQKRPDWAFVQADATAASLPRAAVVLCLDVLIHQPSRAAFDGLLDQAIALADEQLIVAGYGEKAEHTSPITFFYEPLRDALLRRNSFASVEWVGRYRDMDVYRCQKAPAVSAGDDAAPEIIEHNSAYVLTSEERDLLRLVVNVSRTELGFFTNHYPRQIEYPWLLRHAAEKVGQGRHALDMGAGVCPVPIILARTGMKVDTVDIHSLVRRHESKADWNEWGFLDYAPFAAGMRSFNQSVNSLQPDVVYDLIYSISVIEHMPRTEREKFLRNAGQWTKPGSILLLTIDLIPESWQLWNRSEGEIVDAPELHGSFEDLCTEIKDAGFALRKIEIFRALPQSVTDVVCLVAQRF